MHTHTHNYSWSGPCKTVVAVASISLSLTPGRAAQSSVLLCTLHQCARVEDNDDDDEEKKNRVGQWHTRARSLFINRAALLRKKTGSGSSLSLSLAPHSLHTYIRTLYVHCPVICTRELATERERKKKLGNARSRPAKIRVVFRERQAGGRACIGMPFTAARRVIFFFQVYKLRIGGGYIYVYMRASAGIVARRRCSTCRSLARFLARAREIEREASAREAAHSSSSRYCTLWRASAAQHKRKKNLSVFLSRVLLSLLSLSLSLVFLRHTALLHL